MTLAFVCAQLDTGLEIFQLISGKKVCHYLGGDKGGGREVKANGDKVRQGGGGQKPVVVGDILFEWPLKILFFRLILSY